MSGRVLPVLVWGGLAAALAIAIGAGVYSSLLPPSLPEPRLKVMRVPDFALTERSGRTVTRADLEGEWWVADFIFTRCTGICPLLTARMAEIAQRIPDIRLVSFSVDPGHDTAEILASHAKAAVPADIDPGRWLFLTGSREELYALIGEGFHLSVSDTAPKDAPAGELITHSDRLVLVDDEGYIQGMFHGTEEDASERVAGTLAALRGK